MSGNADLFVLNVQSLAAGLAGSDWAVGRKERPGGRSLDYLLRAVSGVGWVQRLLRSLNMPGWRCQVCRSLRWCRSRGNGQWLR